MHKKRLMTRSIPFFFFLGGFLLTLTAQENKTPEELVKKEYPVLYKNYKEKVNKQSATYIFAIDFSTSMKSIEPIVKKNVEIFINSLPNGDRFTIIKEGETAGTNYIYLPNAVISSESKNAIIKNIYQTPFNENGSDGFKLTQKILEAANQTGGNDLIYIFIFTDFEYYTQANGFDKTKCNWNSLKNKYEALNKGKKIVKVGLELPAQNLKPTAIFKTDLNNIFGEVQYYQIIDGGSLTNWFNDTRANILRDRLNYVVNKEIENELLTDQFHLKPIKNHEPDCWIENKKDLIISVEFIQPDKLLECKRPLIEIPFARVKNETAEVKLIYNEKYNNPKKYNEVEKLMQDSNAKQVSIQIHQPQAYIAWWVALILLIIILFLVVSTLITYFRKITRIWNVNVSWKDKNGRSLNVSEIFHKPKYFTIGNGDNVVFNHLSVSNAQWKIKIETRSNFPFFLWIKPGYYLTLEQGELIELEYPYGRSSIVLGLRKPHFLSPPKKFKGGMIKINQSNTVYIVEII